MTRLFLTAAALVMSTGAMGQTIDSSPAIACLSGYHVEGGKCVPDVSWKNLGTRPWANKARRLDGPINQDFLRGVCWGARAAAPQAGDGPITLPSSNGVSIECQK